MKSWKINYKEYACLGKLLAEVKSYEGILLIVNDEEVEVIEDCDLAF